MEEQGGNGSRETEGKRWTKFVSLSQKCVWNEIVGSCADVQVQMLLVAEFWQPICLLVNAL